MDDREIVAAFAAGDPDGLAVAYDEYAESLYGYCRSMLSGPDESAEAVRDTFALAVRQLGHLRDPGKVRSWLFTTARIQCLRRSRGSKPGIDGAGDADGLMDASRLADGGAASTDGSAVAVLREAQREAQRTELREAQREAQRTELRKLIRISLAKLTPDEREAVELSLWHDLDDTDLAAVLDVSRPRAYALATNGRRQLQKALGGRLRPEALGRLLPLPAPPPRLREQVLELGRRPELIADRPPPTPGAPSSPTSRVPQTAALFAAGGGVTGRAGRAAGGDAAGRAWLARWDRIRRKPKVVAAAAVVLVAAAVSVPLMAAGGAHAVRDLVAQSGGTPSDPGPDGTASGETPVSSGTARSQSPQRGGQAGQAPVNYLEPSAASSPKVTPSKSARSPVPSLSDSYPGPAPSHSPSAASSSAAPSPVPSHPKSPPPSSPAPSPTPTKTPTPTPTPSPSPTPTPSRSPSRSPSPSPSPA